MSLDNIQLPGFVIQDLFQKSLVDVSPSEKEKKPKSAAINFFGGNNQHILLLVSDPETTFITDPQLTFLSGILSACKLTLEDIALVNIATLKSPSYKILIEAFIPKIILMFGIAAEQIQLPFVIPEFQRQSYNNHVYLSAPPLNDLENNRDLKRKLWVALQQIFSL